MNETTTTAEDVRSRMDWWRAEARVLRTSRYALQIQAGHHLDELLDTIARVGVDTPRPAATIRMSEPKRVGLTPLVRVSLDAPAERGMIVAEFKFLSPANASKAWRKAHDAADHARRILRAAGLQVELVVDATVEART